MFKPAIQSSTANTAKAAQNAVDGDVTLTSATKADDEPWWCVNFGVEKVVAGVGIANRTCFVFQGIDFFQETFLSNF